MSSLAPEQSQVFQMNRIAENLEMDGNMAIGMKSEVTNGWEKGTDRQTERSN